MHSISDSTEIKKGQNQLLLPQQDCHGSQQQGKTGLERAIPARALCSETHSSWVGVRLLHDDRWIIKQFNKMKGSVGDCEVKSHFLSLAPKAGEQHQSTGCNLHSSRDPSYTYLSQGPKLHNFPPKNRRSRTLDVDYVINRRNSAATYTERNLKIL